MSDKKGLTPKQAHFLRVLQGFIHQNGYSPSYEEMKQNDEEREAELAGSSKKARKTKRKEAKRYKNITLPENSDTRGERVAEALHDVLLAVRKICAFAMERDSGKWSAHANQYKYKVSQLYSKLLDMIQSDLLRERTTYRLLQLRQRRRRYTISSTLSCVR